MPLPSEPRVQSEVQGQCPDSRGFTSVTRGVSHCGLAIYIKKYLKVKEEL